MPSGAEINEGKVQVGRSFVGTSLGRENHVFLLARRRTKTGGLECRLAICLAGQIPIAVGGDRQKAARSGR